MFLGKGALDKVSNTSSPGFSILFLVPKPNGYRRPVINLSLLNLYLRRKSFKIETVRFICSLLKKGFWIFIIDLTDAYFHVSIHPYILPWNTLGSPLESKSLQFKTRGAPWLFTKQMCSVKHIRDSSVLSLLQFLDD